MSLDPARLYEAFDADPSPVVAFLEWIVDRYGIRPPPKVLDVGCGPGRLLTPLSERGWRVVGLEPDAVYRAHAQRVAEPLGVPVQAGGFGDIEGEHEFDLVLGINSSFAHLLTPKDRADALERCHRSLRAGGILVLDLPNLLRVLREYSQPEDQEAEVAGRKIALRRRHTIDYYAATFTTHEEYIVTERNGSTWQMAKDHSYFMTSWPDLQYLLHQAGFDRTEVFGSVTEREPGGSGSRLVIVAGVT